MDVLSQAIAVMRTGQPVSNRIEVSGSWGWDVPPMRGASIHVVLQGSCWLLPREGDPIALGVGDVVFLAQGAAHGMADSPTTPLTTVHADPTGHGVLSFGPATATPSTVLLCCLYRLDQARPHPLLLDFPGIVHLPSRLGQHPSLRTAVELLAAELDDPCHGTDAVVPSLLDALLLYTIRAWLSEQDCSGAHSTGWAAAMEDDAISAALRAVHDAPERPWTVESLGSTAGLSRAAFARRFAGLVGQPPLAYLTWWRMTTAARLLRHGDLPLSSVAARVGYGSEFAFANAFKREYGVAPGRYRRLEPAELAS